MSASAFTKTILGAAAAFEAIANDVWTQSVAAYLDPADILPMLAVDHAWRTLMKDSDLWLNKLTAVVMQYTALEHMDQGSGESAFDWFWRCSRAIGSSASLAERHRNEELPFLRLHGSVDGTCFTPYAELRFPVEYGVICELVALLSRGELPTRGWTRPSCLMCRRWGA